MRRDALVRLTSLALVACGGAPVEAPVVARAPDRPAKPRSACPATIEVGETKVDVGKGWKAAAGAIDFDGWEPANDEDARNVICRLEACGPPPPWFVKPNSIPFRWPAYAVAPLSGGRFAVVPLGGVGISMCLNEGEVNNAVDGFMSGDVIILHEEIQPVVRTDDGCEERGAAEHVHRVIDPSLQRQVVVKTHETVKLTVSGRAVWVQGAGCDEMRMLDP